MPAADSLRPTEAAHVTPGSFRSELLQAARRFKSGWVELAKLLVRVKDEAQYLAWGYSTFEQYCARELNLRRQTATKLVRSYYFLSRHEPREALREGMEKRAPAFEVIEAFAKVEDEHRPMSEAEYREIRDSIWNPDKPAASLKRELYQRFPQWAPRKDRQLGPQRLVEASRKLAEDLARHPSMPSGIAKRAAQVAADVEHWAANLQED